MLSIILNQGHDYFTVGITNFLFYGLEIFKVEARQLHN
jgi:hypothetical protein